MTDSYLGLGEETTFKTAVAAAKYMDMITERIEPDLAWIIPETTAKRAYYKHVEGPYRGKGAVTFLCEPENGLTKLLKWALGAVSSAQQGGTSAYKHTFTPADTIKSFTARVGAVDVATAERILAGALVNRLTLRGAWGREINGEAEIVNFEKETSGSIGSPSFSALKPWVGSQLSAEFADSAKAIVSDYTVNIVNNVPTDFGVMGSDDYPSIRVGKRLVDGTLSLAFDDTTEYARFLAGTDFKLELLHTGPQIGATGYYYKLDIILYACTYIRDTAPHVDRRERIVLNAPFRAFYDATATKEIQVEVTNEETTI